MVCLLQIIIIFSLYITFKFYHYFVLLLLRAAKQIWPSITSIKGVEASEDMIEINQIMLQGKEEKKYIR